MYLDYGAVGVHHVGVLCENLERSLHFYLNILGKSILHGSLFVISNVEYSLEIYI